MWPLLRNGLLVTVVTGASACFFVTDFDGLHGGGSGVGGGGAATGGGGGAGATSGGGVAQAGGMGGTGGAGAGAGASGGMTGQGGQGATGGQTSSGGQGGMGGSLPDVVINEIVADPLPGDEDWIELHNRGATSADLQSWSLTDGSNTFVLPSGSIIAPNGYLTFDRNQPGSFTFGLSKAGETLTLRSDSGSPIDSTTWTDGDGSQPNAWGRSPNGTGPFQTVTPTKNAENM